MIVELRKYTLRPGARDDLIALSDRKFVESQEDCRMTIVGQFRDLDAPTDSSGCAASTRCRLGLRH